MELKILESMMTIMLQARATMQRVPVMMALKKCETRFIGKMIISKVTSLTLYKLRPLNPNQVESYNILKLVRE